MLHLETANIIKNITLVNAQLELYTVWDRGGLQFVHGGTYCTDEDNYKLIFYYIPSYERNYKCNILYNICPS